MGGLELLPEAVLLLDARGRVQSANGAAERLFGGLPGSLAAVPATRLLRDPTRERGFRLPRQPPDARPGQGPAPPPQLRDLEGLRPDGGAFPAQVSLAEREGGYLLVVRDLTEARRREEHAVQVRKMEAIGRLAGGLAHDLNNLLMVMTGNCDLALLRLEADPDRARRMIEQVRRAADRAADLTRQLLALGRRQTLRARTLPVGAFLRGLAERVQTAAGPQARLVMDLPAKETCLRADPGPLADALLVLAENAGEAMPEGGTLTLRARPVDLDVDEARGIGLEPGPYVLLEVRDQGTGMGAATRARLFEPFFTTKPGKRQGLALAAVHGIVGQSGGAIAAESEPGRGATFRIWLPRDPSTEAPEESAEEAAPAPRGAGETVLVVDDQEDVLVLVAQILREQGYRVLEAAGGATALEIAASQSMDLLLTDVVMPDMDGRELAERLTAAHPRTRVLFMSACADGVLARQGVHMGALPLVSKPFRPEDLGRQVRQVLDAPA